MTALLKQMATLRDRSARFVRAAYRVVRQINFRDAPSYWAVLVQRSRTLIHRAHQALSQVDFTDFEGNRAATVKWLKRLLETRSRISTQIYLAFGGAVMLTIAASLVGWYSFDSVGNLQRQVNEGSVPEMSAAFGIAQNANTLVSAVPNLTATTNPDDYNLVAQGVAEANIALVGQLALLQGRYSGDERFDRMRSYTDSLTTNIHTIQRGMVDYFPRAGRLPTLQNEISELGSQLDGTLLNSVDSQFRYLVSESRTPGRLPASLRDSSSWNQEVAYYYQLTELRSNVDTAIQLLTSAFALPDSDSVGPLSDSFASTASEIERNIGGFPDSELRDKIEPMLSHLIDLGTSSQGVFATLGQDLRLVESQRELLSANREISVDLLKEVDVFVDQANAKVEEAGLASGQAVFTGRILLATLSIISIGGATLIAWLFIGRVLLRRLDLLLGWMRRMAGGDLEASVDVEGRDEVADMAAALEVFRRYALEAQRLNLVEHLAEELQGKNEQLESVLEDLRAAQDQIVAREKLAALGELTAGVAHEIRNPLNFVKNFSEVSDELLLELQEIVDEGDGVLTGEKRALIREISGDLSSNLNRIRTHGDRADRIVHDMLMMGRGPTSFQPTDINSLVDEHARLAFHSARATDPDFQLELSHDLDPELGEMKVIPQDIGRVILNLVSNAGYATDQKRRAIADSAVAGQRQFIPTVWLSTRRKESHYEVKVRDNGSGIPLEAVDKIFNPFFTTKPTNEGTGLGLAMSNDIVREHGGTIRVDTTPGQYTEMTLELPFVPPSLDEEQSETDSAGLAV